MKGNRLGLKLWEKNYVFSLALFVAAFYLCLFLIGKGALDQAMENERAAALHIHDLAARSLALDVATLQERQEEDCRPIWPWPRLWWPIITGWAWT